jgi:hypothetical protein
MAKSHIETIDKEMRTIDKRNNGTYCLQLYIVTVGDGGRVKLTYITSHQMS